MAYGDYDTEEVLTAQRDYVQGCQNVASAFSSYGAQISSIVIVTDQGTFTMDQGTWSPTDSNLMLGGILGAMNNMVETLNALIGSYHR